MAIRKDLDDMLNSLKKGSGKKAPEKNSVRQSAPQRKSIYDSMSVDDLLSALNDDKKSSEIAEIAEEISAPERPVTFSEEINVISSSLPKEEAPAPAEAPVPPKKKKRIVITGELPDYEAIRQRELEKDRLAREAAEKAEREEQERLAREAAERAEREEQERLAREAAERAEAHSETEEPSAEELLDAALAAIRNTTALAEEIEENTVAADAANETEPIYGEDDDPVSSMIDGMREDAANVIADLDKPAEGASGDEDDAQEKAEDEAEADDVQKPLAEAKEEKKNVLERILDEDPDELLNERSFSSEEDDNETAVKSRSFRRTLYTVLGAVFAIFAVIGMITVGMKCVRSIKAFTSGEVKKDGFTEVLYPAVIMDIDQFSDPSELSSEQMLTASIWSIIMDSERAAKYTVNPGTDTISIPYMDVEARAVEMFGEDHPEFEHCTVGPVDSRFFYSDGAYNVKPRTISYTYSPEIKSIVKSGSSYTVSVDYVDELPEWMEKSVSKSVEFKLTEHDDGTYTINSMKINYVKSNGL